MKRIMCTASAVLLSCSLFATNFYWCGAGEPNADGTRNWEDPANWLVNGSTATANSYPGVANTDTGALSTSDQAWFTNKTTDEAKVKLSRSLTIGYLYLHQATTSVTLVGGTTTNDVLVINNDFNCDTASEPVTLDGIAVRRNGNLTLGSYRSLSLKNGANLHVNTLTFKVGCGVSVEDASFLRCSGLNGVADGSNILIAKDGSIVRCESNVNLVKGFELNFSGASQLLFQNTAGTAYYNLNAYNAVNTISLAGGSCMVCNEFYMGYPGQIITVDDSAINVRGNCLVGNTLPGGGEMIFKGAAPKFSVKGTAFRVQNNNAGMNTPFVFRYFVPEGGYIQPPFQYLCNTTTEAFGSWVNPTKLTQFVVDPTSAAKTAGTLTDTVLAYSVSGFYRASAKPNYTDITDTTGGTLRFTDLSGATDTKTTDGKNSKYIRASVGSGSPAPVPAVEESSVEKLLIIAVDRKTLTANAIVIKSTAAAKTMVELWGGLAADGSDAAKVAEAEVTASGVYSLVWTAPAGQFDVNYYFTAKVIDYDAGDVELSSDASDRTLAMTKDTTTYTWTGNGEEGNWCDPANWSNNQGGNCLMYPHTASATASFPAKTKVTFVQSAPLTVGWVNANNADVELTFVPAEGMATNEVKWTFNNFNPNAARVKVTLDGGCLYTPGVSLGDHAEIILKNGANWYMNGDFWADNYGSVRLYGDSYLSCNQFGLGGGDSVISDSTLWTRSHDFVGRSKIGGSIRFEGTHPIWWHNNNGGYFYSNLANAGFRLDFLVPVGGFAVAPIRAVSNQNFLMGNNGNNAGSSAITVNVLDESPANRVDEIVTSPLIAWPKGINKTMIVEGTLPDDGQGTDDSFVWSEEANPLTLSVRIVGSTHADSLKISGWPEAAPSPEISPTYGEYIVGLGGTRVCSAPMGSVTISDVKRATCTGWKLYTIDPMTHERTLVDSGEGASYTFTNDDGLWHELEWQWKVEYRISVESEGNGTAAARDVWVETGKKAYLSVEPAPGYAFAKWTGDVELERDKTENLFFIVRDRPYAITANFLPAVEVGPAYPGGLAAAVNANRGKVILLEDGLYEVGAQIAISDNTAIVGKNPGAKAIVKSIAKFGTDVNAPCSVFKLSHADARLYNIAITTDADRESSLRDAANNLYKEGRARGVWIEKAGLVDGCVITNCAPHYNGQGGAVYLNAGGIVRNTFVHNCRVYSSGGNNAQGAAFSLANGGLVESCEVHDCGLPYNASSSAAVRMTGGTVRNSLIADSTQGHNAGDQMRGVAFFLSPAVNYTCTIENCTIVGNYQLASTTATGVYFWDCNGTTQHIVFRNNVIWGNLNSMGIDNWAKRNANISITESNNCTTPTLGGEGDITEDPSFTDEAGKDYTLTYSAAVDSALEQDWMGSVLSLDGKERVIGAAPDMGCYEFEPDGLVCGFTAAAAGTLGEDTITLKASVLGDTDGIVYTWTLVDQNGDMIVTNGADLATLVLTLPIGQYTVTLGVVNGAGEEGSATKPNIAKVFPADVYLSTTGADVYPYDSYATGATSLVTVLAAATDGTVIHVDDGQYYEADTVAITKAVKIVSKTGPESTSIFAAAQTDKTPMILLANKGAVISGIAIDGLNQNGESRNQWSGLQITMEGGTVTNCIVRNNTTVSISVAGAGCRMEGGLVIDSVFSNNWTRCSGGAGQKGGAISVTGANALVQRCRIVDNKIATGTPSYGAGVYMNAGKMFNSFIQGNFSQSYGGGLAVEGSALVRNCTIVENEASTGNGGIWQGGNAVVQDCLVWHNTANGALQDLDDPGFVNGAEGDFHLLGGVAAVDAVADATELGAYDLDLNPRVSGDAADQGCFERDANAFSLGISYEKLSAFAPGLVRFTAVVKPEGTALNEGQTWWTFDGTEPSASNYDAIGTVVEKEIAPGSVTVRFKTFYQSEIYTINKEDWFTAFGEHVYVNLESANPVYPFNSPETAATDYEEAMLCVQPGGTVHLAPGTYPVTKTQNLTFPVKVVAEGGPAQTVLDLGTTGNWSTPQAFVIVDPNVTISGLGFVGARSWGNGGAINMTGGTVTNCVFTDCLGHNSSPGGAVWMFGGLVVDCLFDGCGSNHYNSQSSNQGGVIYAVGPNSVIDRCVIQNSKTVQVDDPAQSVLTWGAVCLADNGGSGTIRNSVITGSEFRGTGGIVAWRNAKIENCTIYANVTTNMANVAAGIAISNATVQVVNTIVYGNRCETTPAEIGGVAGYEACFDHCLIGVDPGLKLGGSYPYSIGSSSPARDAGVELDWMVGAKDLYGHARIFGKNVDIGAGECDASPATKMILR